MFTRCPACHTVYPVNAALLARGSGRFRCGKCNKKCNALLALFDEWPEPGQSPVAPGNLPVLGMNIDLEDAARSRHDPESASPTGTTESEYPAPTRSSNRWLRSLWMVAGLVVVVAVVFELAEFSGHPVVREGGVENALVRIGLKEPPRVETFRDPGQIHLVSRELTTLADRPGILRLSATIVNRAPRSQPYPSIEIILFDANGEDLAKRRYQPENYLAESYRPGSLMASQAYLPLTLEMEDPGERAVGFELEFH
jgi:predicted Zn finger-like uncharacterized protein